MSFQDLSISGSPTPRAESRGAVSARHQKVKQRTHSGKSMGGGAVVTRDQLNLAKKLAYYETEVDKAKQELNAYNSKKDNTQTKAPVQREAINKSRSQPPPIKTQVPPLKLSMLKQKSDSSQYHVTRGVDTSRSVLSWGDPSYRDTRPHGVGKINTGGDKRKGVDKENRRKEEQREERRKEEQREKENRDIEHRAETSRTEQGEEGADPDGDIERDTGQELGFEAFETEEGKIKRARQEDAVETQMVQDLTQPETTDEEPNSYTLRTPWATSERADFYALKEIPHVKRIDNSLHTTSKELTFSNLNNRGVQKRLKFRLRIISRCGRDSLRDLHGFYFLSDDSIVVYEYKEIGKRVTASPLFPRTVYRHPRGRWIGNSYSLRDLKIGSTLDLPTSNNPALPASITRAPYTLLRVMGVDQEDVLSLVYDGCRIEDRADRAEQIKDFVTPEQIWRIRNLEHIQGQIRTQLRSRPLRSLVGLGHYFILHDKDKDGFWRADELQAVLRTFRIKLSHQDFVVFWDILDEDGSGLLDVGEFLRGLLGEMSEARVGIVYRAWIKMDPGRVGEVAYKTVGQFYNPAVSLNPDSDGTSTKEQLVEEFLECFSAGPLNQKITYSEFVDYYTALSLSEEEDEVFVTFMKHCWNV
ncbi:calcyphosin-2-like [Bolinopsis microptera]|uniref:calcyphosin-2-like n=1 Tax=Bolinopsis microptera TaxID=2820187 RepID=UPI00307AE67F